MMRILLCASMAIVLLCCMGCQHKYIGTDGKEHSSMVVTSPAFTQGGMIPKQYTVDGKGLSPALAWSAIPQQTKTFALICDDPDAPIGTFVHWVLYNMPASMTQLPEGIQRIGTYPNGMMSGVSDDGLFGYTPLSPPKGIHRYYFKVYALDIALPLKPGATKVGLERAMRDHILAEGELMGRYQRVNSGK